MPLLDHPSLQSALAALRPTEPFAHQAPPREPVHVVYGGAHLFRAQTARKLGGLARAALAEYGEGPGRFFELLGLSVPPEQAGPLYRRVEEKLEREPVEDFRLDFEDGYGERPDAEEDGHARSAAQELARGHREGTLPPFVGLRIKALGASTRGRALRTLELFLRALVEGTGGALPQGFVVTLPKVASAAEVALLVQALGVLEAELGLSPGTLRLELMMETPAMLLSSRGEPVLARFVEAAGGRCGAVHLGAYDYTALLGIAAQDQGLGHPACDFARQWMLLALHGSGVRLSDGATNLLPLPPHRAAPGQALSDGERAANAQAVREAWALHARNVDRALREGIYQGWDLHPAQLPVRYAVLYAFFAHALTPAAARLRGFLERAAQATRLGNVFDDAASAQGLLNVFLRAFRCGAASAEDVERWTGFPVDALASRSFSALTRA